jgi:hypothetical protein
VMTEWTVVTEAIETTEEEMIVVIVAEKLQVEMIVESKLIGLITIGIWEKADASNAVVGVTENVSAVTDQSQDQVHLEEERVVEEDPTLADHTALIKREEEREEEAPPQDQEADVQTRADQSNQKTVERAVKIAEEERLTEHLKIAKKSGNTQLTVEIKEVTQEDQETQEDLKAQETLEEAAVKAPLLEIDLLNNTHLSQNKMETKIRKSDSLK